MEAKNKNVVAITCNSTCTFNDFKLNLKRLPSGSPCRWRLWPPRPHPAPRHLHDILPGSPCCSFPIKRSMKNPEHSRTSLQKMSSWSFLDLDPSTTSNHGGTAKDRCSCLGSWCNKMSLENVRSKEKIICVQLRLNKYLKPHVKPVLQNENTHHKYWSSEKKKKKHVNKSDFDPHK